MKDNNDMLLKYIIKEIAEDTKKRCFDDFSENYNKYDKDGVKNILIKFSTLDFYKTLCTPGVSADFDIACAIDYLGIDNCLNYFKAFCQKFNSNTLEGIDINTEYNLRIGYYNFTEKLYGKTGLFCKEWFRNFGVRSTDTAFISLTLEEQKKVYKVFDDTIDKINNTLDRIINKEVGFRGIPKSFKLLSEQEMLNNMKMTLSECYDLIYKMNEIIETNEKQLTNSKKK